MKKYFLILYSLLLLGPFWSCKQAPDVDYTEEYRTVYMAKAVDLQDFIFQQSLGSNKIFVGASYGGVDYAPEDIQVQFETDMSLVSQYNDQYGTNFLPLPLNNITFVKKDAVIKKGDLQTDALPIDIDFAGLSTFTSYLLPVKITSVSGGVPLKETLRTTYFRIEVRSDPVPVKIMSLGKGGTNNDMDKLSQIILDANVDIALIREIDKNTTRSGSTSDWPAILAQKLPGYQYVFVPSILAYQGGQYGMAVYTKYAMSNVQLYRLVAKGTSQADNTERGPFATMDLDINGKKLKLATVHTNTDGPTRATQLGEMIEILGDDDGKPSVLVGNMNANPNGGDSYAALSGIGFGPVCTTCQPNFSVSNPASWSDMTLYRPSGRFSVVSHVVGTAQQVIGTGTHLPIFTTLNVYF